MTGTPGGRGRELWALRGALCGHRGVPPARRNATHRRRSRRSCARRSRASPPSAEAGPGGSGRWSRCPPSRCPRLRVCVCMHVSRQRPSPIQFAHATPAPMHPRTVVGEQRAEGSAHDLGAVDDGHHLPLHPVPDGEAVYVCVVWCEMGAGERRARHLFTRSFLPIRTCRHSRRWTRGSSRRRAPCRGAGT